MGSSGVAAGRTPTKPEAAKLHGLDSQTIGSGKIFGEFRPRCRQTAIGRYTEQGERHFERNRGRLGAAVSQFTRADSHVHVSIQIQGGNLSSLRETCSVGYEAHAQAGHS